MEAVMAKRYLHQRHLEERELDIEQGGKKDALVRMANDSEDRAKEKRYLNAQHKEQRETDIEGHLLETARLRKEREQTEQDELALATEQRRVELEKLCDEKMRQRVREESEEIRRLKSQLEAAYANKVRDAQIREKKERIAAEINADLVSQAETERQMKEHARKAEQAEKKSKLESAEKYQRELEAQLTAREQQIELAYQQYLKDKHIVDEVVRKIYEEDAKKRETEMSKKQEQRKYIEQFKEEQRQWNETEKQRLQAEAEKIKQYEEEQHRRTQERQSNLAEEATAKLKVQDALADELRNKQEERDEYERVLQELLQNEQEEKARQDEIRSMEKRINDRIALQGYHALQMRMNNERRAAQAEEEETYRMRLMAKFAEDDRIELMNAQKRRMKQQDHKRSVEALLEERRKQVQLERERELLDRDREKEEAKIRAEIIEEERQQLLDTHVKNLLGYLPKGVLRDANDVERFAPSYVLLTNEELKKQNP